MFDDAEFFASLWLFNHCCDQGCADTSATRSSATTQVVQYSGSPSSWSRVSVNASPGNYSMDLTCEDSEALDAVTVSVFAAGSLLARQAWDDTLVPPNTTQLQVPHAKQTGCYITVVVYVESYGDEMGWSIDSALFSGGPYEGTNQEYRESIFLAPAQNHRFQVRAAAACAYPLVDIRPYITVWPSVLCYSLRV
jgi:hypothetical protein